MPTDKEFKDMRESAGLEVDIPTFGAMLKARWPKKEDREAYFRWSWAGVVKKLNHSNTPVSKEEFIKLVDTINFSNSEQAAKLTEMMTRDARPWIPLGKDDGEVAYRLIPEAYGLRPQKLEYKTDREILPPSFLGVNIMIQPREPSKPANRRKDMLSVESTISAESDDNAPGFEFHQLGILEYYLGELPDNMAEAAEGEWLPTGFNVVASLRKTGYIDGIYVIYDMFPEDQDGDRQQITDEPWGFPPGSEEQFSCARIGSKLGAFKTNFGTRIRWMEKTENPVELVRVVRTGDGRLMRITV